MRQVAIPKEVNCVKKPVSNPLTSACIIGTEENENLIGTSQNDCINGKGGKDKIACLAGNDKLNGGDG